MAKSVLKIVLSRIFGFIFFLILLGIANILVRFIPSSVYAAVINFFNTNILLFLGMMLVGMVNEIFWSFYFPFNILAPVASAILSIFIVSFIYRAWSFLDTFFRTNFVLPGSLYLPIALIILFFGYIAILTRKGKPKEEFDIDAKKPLPKGAAGAVAQKKKLDEQVEWEDVSNEFKLALYNIGRSINKNFEKKPKRSNKKARKKAKQLK
jgi:hypothetical protein